MGKLFNDQDGNSTQRGGSRQPSPLEQRLEQLRSAASAGRGRSRLAGFISVWQVISMILDVVTAGVLIYAVLNWEEFSYGLVSQATQLLSVALTFTVLAVLLLAGVVTHWQEVRGWLFSVADSLVSFGIQVFFMVVGIQMMLGWFRRM